MTDERWDELVRRLDDVAREKPRAYRFRVGALAGLGYAYLGFAIVLLLGGAAAIVWIAFASAAWLIKFAIPLLVIVFIVLRSLWFRLPEPEGVEVKREDAPELWGAVDEIRGRVRGPKVHRLLLDDELNAAVVQTPRFGPVGPVKNHLVIGLPLLQALSPEEARAVIAHEFGHLSGNHSRFAGWIYRVRRTYANVLTQLEARRSHGIWLFRSFFGWYAPYFAAYSFALARGNEYEADAAAAEASSREDAASALLRIERTAHWLGSHFWPQLHDRVRIDPQPPANAFTTLRSSLPLDRDAHDEEVVQAAFRRETDTTDTHPSLSDRLAGLGVDRDEVTARALTRPRTTAAQALLGEGESELLARFDARYRDDVAPAWQMRHEQAEQDRSRLAELRAKRDLDTDERAEMGFLVEEFDGTDAAVPLMRQVLAERAGHPGANFLIGRHLLENGDDTGLAHLDRAMEADEDAILPACQIAYAYLTERDREPDADRYLERAKARAEVLDAAEDERAEVTTADDYIPHQLSDDEVMEVRRHLESEKRVDRGYLVRKRLRHLPDREPVFLVAISVRRFTSDVDELLQRLADAIPLPGRVYVINLSGDNTSFEPLLRDVPTSLIY